MAFVGPVRDPSSLIPSGSIAEQLRKSGGGRAIIEGTGAWERKEAARKKAVAQAEADARARADAKRLKELEEHRTRLRTEAAALTQQQAIELSRLKSEQRTRARAEWTALPSETRRQLREEQRVRDILKRKPSATLNPRYEAARERLEKKEAIAEFKEKISRPQIETIRIDPRTGKPFGKVEVAPTLKEQFQVSREQHGQILGTLSFLGWKAGEAVKRAEPTSPSYPYRGPALGTLTTRAVETAPYFVPYVGPALALGVGTEALVTPAGRRRIGARAEQWEAEKGVPKGVGIAGQVALNVALIYGGGRMTYRSVEKLAGFPKTTTKVLGVTQRLEDRKVITDIVFETKTRRLIGARTDIGYARGISSIKDFKSLQVSGTLTKGVFGEKIVKLPSTAVKVGKKTKFFSAQVSVSQPTTITESAAFKKLLVTAKKEGFAQVSFGKIAVGKKEPISFTGIGGSYPTGTREYIFGQTGVVRRGRILRAGKGKFEGLIWKAPKDKITKFVPSDSKLSPLIQKQMFEARVSEVLAPTTKAVSIARAPPSMTIKAIAPLPTITEVSAPPIIRQLVVEKPVVSRITGMVVSKEVPKVTQVSLPKLAQIPKTKQRVAPSTAQAVTPAQKERERQALRIAQVPVAVQKRKVAQRYKQALAVGLIQRQEYKLAKPMTFPMPLGLFAARPKKLFPIVLPRFKGKTEEELFPTYGVAVRRRGKFAPIGTGLSLKQAFAVGRERVGKTLAATFKIIGRPKALKVPKGFYVKPTKKGVLFIERKGLRLSTRPEVKEIHVAKRRKK